jgi:ATP-binding protein involved in chromosome partitioning
MSMSDAVRAEDVLQVLRRVQDPDLHRDIVDLGFVKDLRIDAGTVSFAIELTTPACPVKDQMEAQARQLVAALPGVRAVQVRMTASVRAAAPAQTPELAGIRNLVAVASGKGGVGKSTVAVNLALALQRDGARTGLLDADIYGPSIPIMLGTHAAPPGMRGNMILPIDVHGVKAMSIGFLAGPEMPVIWRGPMVHKMVSQLLGNVAWGDLDYLVIDLPPGTGDAQLTLTQSAPLSGAVIVTTPQDVALEDVYRGVRMFEQVKVPILGIIENMSYYACAHCGHRDEIFSHGGGRRAAAKYEVPFLGEIPIVPAIRAAGDRGVPIVAAEPESAAAQAFVTVARSVAAQLSTLAMRGAGRRPTIKFS